jgi:hypothetical protein
MDYFHSLWTKPMSTRWDIKEQLFKTRMFSALSVYWVHRWGRKIHLITDSFGAEFMKDVPYDSVSTTLDVLKDADPIFWAHGKIEAYKHMVLGHAHIDYDLFLQKEDGCKAIEQSHAPVTVFNTENAHDTHYHCYTRELQSVHHLTWDIYDSMQGKALCTAICKFCDADLKEQYIADYEKGVARISEFYKNIPAESRKWKIPDLLLEQHMLADLCDRMNKPYQVILPTRPHEKAEELGIAHVYGSQKYTKIPVVAETLATVCPEVYEQIKGDESWMKQP